MPTTNEYSDTRWVNVSLSALASAAPELTRAQGLRGIASFLVLGSHIARSCAPIILSPALSENGASSIWQQPLIRNIFMGRASIAVFAILAGYVNSLKAIRESRAGHADAALASISNSAFKRTGRFIVPAVTATLASWLACQLGAFRLAKQSGWEWIRDSSPEPSRSLPEAVYDLLLNIGRTWTEGSNAYDPVQWTLTFLLRGSMLVYLTSFALVHVQSSKRYLFYASLYFYYFWVGDGKLAALL